MLAVTFACGYRQAGITTLQRRCADSIAATASSADSLKALHLRLQSAGNTLADVATLRRLGMVLRNESRFDEALRVHEQELKLAEGMGDTIETVRALNAIGTNYRRLGMLDVAQEYHYRALIMSRESSDTSVLARKNLSESLNGMGNIYITMGNYAMADSTLRLALEDDRRLGSDVGMAINYANLGKIFERHRQADSAWAYYRMSLAYNLKASNRLGVALCHTAFGSLFEHDGRLADASKEYELAYRSMKASADTWHSLTPLIGMARVCHAIGNERQALCHLDSARALAEKMGAKEQQARIHELYYKVYESEGDYRHALRHHVLAKAMEDSVVGQEKQNRIESMRRTIDRELQQHRIAKAEHAVQSERTAKRISIAVLVVMLVAFALVFALMFYVQRIRSHSLEALRQVNRMRESFFTNITHEFRTPLTLILGMGSDLQHDSLTSEETRRIGEGIERQGNGLLTLINQLLDISKVKSAVGTPDWRYGNIAAQIEMIVDTYRDFARCRDINLQLFSPKEVMTDFVPDYLAKALNNLISNAIKFTPTYGTVSVTVEESDGKLIISVADTGKGMLPEVQKHIFEPFYQAPDDTYNVGTGVGLALTKQIVDCVGASIKVESTLGQGSTFRISAPITKGKGRPFAPGETAENTPMPVGKTDEPMPDDDETEVDEQRRRALVIEDNGEVAAYIGEQLPADFRIFYARNGSQGIEKARKLVPDIIITDVMMPGISGLEVCRRVRADELTSHIPIVIVTAKITDEDRMRGLAAGADAYLAKPFRPEELTMRVEKLLEQRRLLRRKYSRAAVEVKEAMPNDADQRFLTKCTDYVYLLLNSNHPVDVAAVASHLCMSYSQFYRKLSAVTGSTPTQYIQRIKVKKARRLLDTNPQMSFKDVAEQCGFSDYSNFVRAFKNVCEVTPTQYVRRAE